MSTRSRVYPTSCTSAYCGKINCPSECQNKSELDAFEAWKAETKAVQADRIWSPNVYIATVSI
jgi:hypothetical protein